MTKRYLNVLTTGDIKDSITGELIRGSGIGDLLNKLSEENEQLKAQLKDCEKRVTNKEVEWLRNNTVWEQMPSNKRTFITTSTKEDYK